MRQEKPTRLESLLLICGIYFWKKGVDAYYFPTFDEIEAFLLENCIHGDVLITMGAGDVYKIGENLLGL